MVASLAACSTTPATGSATPATVGSSPPTVEPNPFRGVVEQAALRGVQEHAAVGLVVAVQLPDEELLVVPAGWADAENEIPMPASAIFDIGSVHKPFKWAALLLLASRGDVDLDAEVNDYVDEPSLPGVTVRDLMHHSSGMIDIPESAAFMADAQDDQTRTFDYDDMIGYLRASNGRTASGPYAAGRFRTFAVGQDVSYSSFGPLIANRIVEVVTGIAAHEFTRREILTPLGLDETSFMGTDDDPAGLTPGYADPNTINPFFPDAESTRSFSSGNGGAMHSSAADVATFVHALFTSPGFGGASTALALRDEPRAGNGISTRAGVLRFDRWPEGLWGHAGNGIRSHTALAVHDRASGATIVVLTNMNTAVDDYAGNEAVVTQIVNALRAR